MTTGLEDFWLLEEIFGKHEFHSQYKFNIFSDPESFITMLINGGIFNDYYWEDDIFPTQVTRDGRTTKIDYFKDSK